MYYTTGCSICGKPLEYFSPAKKFPCEICGQVYETNAACADGHFICDACHAQQGIDFISDYALKSESEQFGIEMETPGSVYCAFSAKNKQCKKENCLFYPKPVVNNDEGKYKIAFVCVHNSCRSQIAEALAKRFLGDAFAVYSAGTETKPRINQDAVRLMKQLYNIDMEKAQYPKLLSAIPPVDLVITMGCDVECPSQPCKHREDWGLDDPTGKSDEAFMQVIHQIEEKVHALPCRDLPVDCRKA